MCAKELRKADEAGSFIKKMQSHLSKQSKDQQPEHERQAQILASNDVQVMRALCNSQNLRSGGDKETLFIRLLNPEDQKNKKRKKQSSQQSQQQSQYSQQGETPQEINKQTQQARPQEIFEEMSKLQLRDLCASKNLKCSGNKTELIERLKNPNDPAHLKQIGKRKRSEPSVSVGSSTQSTSSTKKTKKDADDNKKKRKAAIGVAPSRD